MSKVIETLKEIILEQGHKSDNLAIYVSGGGVAIRFFHYENYKAVVSKLRILANELEKSVKERKDES